jgi:excisionase family DNA binding protein
MTTPGPSEFFDKSSTDARGMLSVAEAATLLGVSRPTMRRLQQERRIPFFKVGRCVRFARSDLASYLAKRRIASVD